MKTKTATVKKMTKSERLKELSAFIGLCLMSLDTLDSKEIANKAVVSFSTVERLKAGQFSLCIRFGTVQGLGIAAGLKLEQTEYSSGVVLINR